MMVSNPYVFGLPLLGTVVPFEKRDAAPVEPVIYMAPRGLDLQDPVKMDAYGILSGSHKLSL